MWFLQTNFMCQPSGLPSEGAKLQASRNGPRLKAMRNSPFTDGDCGYVCIYIWVMPNNSPDDQGHSA
jgi:hypothetical protein